MEKIIKIIIKGGLVQDVEGLPKGYIYEVDDKDLRAEEPTEEKF